MQYCLAINTVKNRETFCDVIDNVAEKSPKKFCTRLKATLNNYFFQPVDRISTIGKHCLSKRFEKKKCWIDFRSVTDSKHGTALACTGLRNRQTLSGLIPNTQYFVDVFGIHKTVPGLIFKMASTTFVFNNSNTIELHEDQTEIGRLSAFDKRSSFVFKVNCSTIRLKNI